MERVNVLQTGRTTVVYSSSRTGFWMLLACSAVRALVHGSTYQHDQVDMQF